MPSPLPQEMLKQCEAKAKEYLDGWQRAKADFINYKNDEAKRLEDTARFISRSFIQDVLPVLDSFDLALKTYESFVGYGDTAHQYDEGRGLLLIRSQLLDMLKKRGLEVISVDAGGKFDPEQHEALGEMESDLPSGTIAQEVQKGYTLHGRIIRPVRVRVSKPLT